MMKNTLTEKEISLARLCIDIAAEAGAQQSRVTIDKSCMDLVGTLNGEIDKVTHCLDRPVSLSLYVDGKYGSFSTNRLEEDSLRSFIHQAADTVRMLAPEKWRTLPDPARTEKCAVSGNELGLVDAAYDDITPEKRVELALGASVFSSPIIPEGVSLISEECEFSDSISDTLLIDSQGTFCRHTETTFNFGVEMTVCDGQGRKYNSYWWDSSPRLSDISLRECSKKALMRTLAQLGPRPHKGGQMNMVVDSECASRLVTPLLSALSGFRIQQKNSFLTGKLGRKVFSEGLTITDICRHPGFGGSQLFDTEGVATREWDIIRGGKVNGYFLNTYMAGKMHRAPTAEDAVRPKVLPWPRPMGRDDILKLCGSGIYVTGFNGGNSNSSTGDFSFGIEGFAFSRGRITHPVREMLITGNLVDLWQHLLAAGDDARLCMSKVIPTLAFSNVQFR